MPLRTYIFECSNDTFAECIQRGLFGSHLRWPLGVQKGDCCFLYHYGTHNVLALWEATTDGAENIESSAYRFGHDRLPLQRFIGWAEWDDTPLRQELTRQVAEPLGHADAVLVFDPSAFAKAGAESVGVARQWCGRLGKVDNCQVAIYLGYVSGV